MWGCAWAEGGPAWLDKVKVVQTGQISWAGAKHAKKARHESGMARNNFMSGRCWAVIGSRAARPDPIKSIQ